MMYYSVGKKITPILVKGMSRVCTDRVMPCLVIQQLSAKEMTGRMVGWVVDCWREFSGLVPLYNTTREPTLN